MIEARIDDPNLGIFVSAVAARKEDAEHMVQQEYLRKKKEILAAKPIVADKEWDVL